jgi:branched-chain amino acid transport system substrate-binding protein
MSRTWHSSEWHWLERLRKELQMNISMRGRATLAVVGVTTLAIMLAGCSSSGGTPAPTTSSSSTAALPAAATCATGTDPSTTFKLGTFLPLTGSLASLGPAAVAGAGEALSEINKNGGVNGKPACVISTDSSDTTNPTIGNQSIQSLRP